MYVKSQTWIENGPARSASPLPAVLPIAGSTLARNGAGIHGGRPSPVRAIRPAWRRRGVGDQGQPYDAYCNSASTWNPFNWFLCFPHDVGVVASNVAGINSVTAQLPPAPPNNIALLTGAAAASTPGAIFAGNDSSGNPIYAVPQTADANMAAYAATLQQFMTNLDTTNNPPVDCSTMWNQFTNSQCGGSKLPLILGGALVVGLVLFSGRRR